MKHSYFLLVAIVCLFVAQTSADPRRKLGGSNRKSGGGSKRPSSNGGGSNYDLASLSYPGHNSAPKKPQSSVPEPPKNQPIGWSINKDSASKPNNFGQQQANIPSYPASGGLSGTGSKPNPAHTYPASSGNSGSGQHSYPASSGNSGTGSQHSYPSSGGLSGTGQQASNVKPVQTSNANPAQSYPTNNNPSYNNPYNKPPAYTPNAPGHAGAPPPYSQNAPGYHPQGGYHQPGGYNQPGGYHQPGYHQPSYSVPAPGFGGYHPPPGYSGYGGYGQSGFGGMGMFGGGLGNYGYQRKSGFLSSNTFGAILAGLAVWNLVRSGSKTTNNYYYYADNSTKNDPHAYVPDPIVNELEKCTLTISSDSKTEVTLIPCIIVSSVAINAESAGPNKTPDADGLSCMITLLFKNATSKNVNMPCADLSTLAPKENPSNQTNCDPSLGNCPPAPPQALFDAPPLSVIPLNHNSSSTMNPAIEEASTTSTEATSTSTEATSTTTLSTSTTTTEAAKSSTVTESTSTSSTEATSTVEATSSTTTEATSTTSTTTEAATTQSSSDSTSS